MLLQIDENATRIYGEVMGYRRGIGRPISSLDGQIEAIARSRNFAVATRNIKDFEECQLNLIDPFSG